MGTRIEPTVGRVVWFFSSDIDRELAATIACVLNNGRINIGYLGQNGVHYNATEVPLVQDGEPLPKGAYCTWMPYQKGQAAKTEALEARLAPATR